MSVVLTSYTPLDAPGGVPRFNRDLMPAFPGAKHYSWCDVPGHESSSLPEWEKAKVLNQWLRQTKKITKEDVIITDGFWGLGLEDFPKVISVAHGNWSHTTKDDVARGIPPEFPQHHAVQLNYRREHQKRDGWIVAVSLFIAHQCKIQWGLKMPYINNGIDLDKFHPGLRTELSDKKLIIHGVTTVNKGFDHIEAVKKELPEADVLLLDDAAAKFSVDKYTALASADLVVHPSAHEGNSFFLLEALACGVPVISYDVGLMFEAMHNLSENGSIGLISDRKLRLPETTSFITKLTLSRERDVLEKKRENARKFAEQFSVQNFRNEWKKFVETEFGPIIRQ